MSDSLKGFLETLQQGDGFVFFSGWICKADNTSLETVRLEVPGFFSVELRSLYPRADLLAVGITGPAAFDVAVPCGAALTDEVNLFAVVAGEEPYRLNRHDSATAFRSFGAIDMIDSNGVSGWLFDPGVLLGRSQAFVAAAGRRHAIGLTTVRRDLPFACVGYDGPLGFHVPWADFGLAAAVADGCETVAELESSGVAIDRQSVDLPARTTPAPEAGAAPDAGNGPDRSGDIDRTLPASSPVLTKRAMRDTFERFRIYFDPAFYAARSIGEEVDEVAALNHYLDTGLQRLSMLSPLVDPTYMTTLRPDLFSEQPTLAEILDCLDQNLCDPSPHFSLSYYRTQAAELQPNQGMLRHFLTHSGDEFKRPNPFFELSHYKSHIEKPQSNLQIFYDFILRGDRERLSSSRHFDPVLYAEDCAPGDLAAFGPLEHYLRIGRFEGRTIYPLTKMGSGREFHRSATSEWVFEAEPKIWKNNYEELTQALSVAMRRSIVDFKERSLLADLPWLGQPIGSLHLPPAPEPDIDIVIPAYNEFDHTLNALLSIAHSVTGISYRVLLIDDASPDPQMAAFADVPNLVYIRNETNLHFLRSCNAAFRRCTAPYVLLLNNDALLFADTLQRLHEVIDADATIGCVGPKILYPNGRLQEAGCYIRSDGGTKMIGLGDDPDRGGYTYDRDVEYVSGACILFRREAVAEDLFDERFRPAYCEDVDLGLRLMARGLRTRYVAGARAIHHLSVSTGKASEVKRVQLSSRNQAKLAQKWASMLVAKSRVRVLSFYLPQFHPSPENDLWWGKGFTEWSNASRAVPSYRGHYQPHLPADLGYYDLRMSSVLGEQQRLANRYGVEGFVVYYYNFGSRRLLWEPMANLLSQKDIDFRFCLCWANENWTKHWDGGDKEMLVEQRYDAGTLDSVCQDFVASARDERFIRVNGKPMVLVYRPLLFPDIQAFAALVRRRFKEAGFAGVHLCYVESMEAVSKGIRPADIGFDAAVEFPPQGVGVRAKLSLGDTKEGWEGNVYDYRSTVVTACTRAPVAYPRYPGVFPSWDNTARQPLKATSFHDVSPELFQAYVEAKIDTLNSAFVGEERLIFVNAWNEWAEGTHLEPDRAYGHAWLEALRNGVERV